MTVNRLWMDKKKHASVSSQPIFQGPDAWLLRKLEIKRDNQWSVYKSSRMKKHQGSLTIGLLVPAAQEKREEKSMEMRL